MACSLLRSLHFNGNNTILGVWADMFARLFTTMVRFDMAYYTIFNCNWKQIRYDFPNIHLWLRKLYYEIEEESKGSFKSTTHFEIVSQILMLRTRLTSTLVHGRVCPFCDEVEDCALGTSNSNYAIGRIRVQRATYIVQVKIWIMGRCHRFSGIGDLNCRSKSLLVL